MGDATGIIEGILLGLHGRFGECYPNHAKSNDMEAEWIWGSGV